MVSAFTFELEGYEKLIEKLKNKSGDLVNKVDSAIEDTAQDIRTAATRRAPAIAGGGGGIRGNIVVERLGKMSRTVVSSKDYSAYVEFGTGALVNVPAGLEDYAIQFKGKGIKQVNLPARPFFFNSYQEERVKLIAELKKILGTL